MVFASDTGNYLDVGNVRQAFYRILTAAGLRHIRFHMLSSTPTIRRFKSADDACATATAP